MFHKEIKHIVFYLSYKGGKAEDLVSFGLDVKVWVVVSLLSLLVWIAYTLRPSIEYIFNIGQSVTQEYVNFLGIVFWAGHVGLDFRFIGAILGLVSVFLVWDRAKPFSRVKSLVAAALLMEVIYFLSLVPTVEYSIRLGRIFGSGSITLSITYLLQIILTVPFLTILAFKVKNYDNIKQRQSMWKWSGIAFVGYLAALWVNAVFRWFDMISAEGIMFLLSGSRAVGFLNAVVFMSLAVAFAVVGAYSVTKKSKIYWTRWVGLALVMVGLHYVIYVVYSYFVGALNFVWLLDVWAIPLLGLGIYLLKTKT